LPSKAITFSIAAIAMSLEDIDFKEVHKNIVDHINRGRWVDKEGRALKPQILASKLREVLKGFKTFRIKNRMKVKKLQPLSITKEYIGARGSEISLVVENASIA